MKYLIIAFLVVPTFLNVDANLSAITSAISSGNADALGQHFSNSVEISVLGNADFYSKTEGIQVVKKFFSQYRPQSFQQRHKGSSPGNSQYCIGNMATSKGSFRVSIYLSRSGNIDEMRFEKGK